MTKWVCSGGRWCPADESTVAYTAPSGRDGTGIFSSMRTAGGVPLLLPAHLARLNGHCRALGWPVLPDEEWFRTRVREGVETARALSGGGREPAAEFRLRIEYWQSGGQFEPAMRLAPLVEPGIVRLWPAPTGSARPRPEIKFISQPALHQFEALAQAAGADEAVLSRVDGAVTETSRSNLIWADQNGRLQTPRGPALPGVMLDWALTRLRAAGLEIISVDAPLDELRRAREIVVTSGVKGPVTAVFPAGATAVPEDAPPGNGLSNASSDGFIMHHLSKCFQELLVSTRDSCDSLSTTD